MEQKQVTRPNQLTPKRLRQALKVWGQSPELGEHPLAQWDMVRRRQEERMLGATAVGRGIALRQLLQEGIEALKPAGAEPDYAQRAWRCYHILRQQFVQDRRAKEICDELGISESGYFADQNHALEQLIGILQEWEAQAAVTPPTAATIPTATTPHTAHTPPPRLRNNLPQQLTPFLGRTAELQTIGELLTKPDCRLITLVGTGGMGKTRLSLEAARQNQAEFADGVYFIALSPLRSKASMVPTIAQAVGLPFDTEEAQIQQLGHFLRPKKILLIMDNFEHLMDGTPLVADLLQEASGLKILATSRERLNLRGEWVIDLVGMAFPPALSDNEGLDWEAYSAVNLFRLAAERALGGASLSASEWPEMVRICRLLHGLPLGIELAASWVRLLPCREIAQEIEKSLDFLEGTFRDLPERHQSLRAVFNHSWLLLSAREQTVFPRLSVFRGPFDRHMAQEVAGAPLPLLQALCHKSLLVVSGDGRYAIHELLRQYAAEKLQDNTQEWLATHNRHSQAVCQFLREHNAALKQGGNQKAVLHQIEQVVEDIRAAWQWALAQEQTELLLEACEPLYHASHMLNRLQEGMEAFERIGQKWHNQPRLSLEQRRLLGLALALQGRLAFRLNQSAKARQLFQDSLAQLQPFGSPTQKALAGMLAIQVNLPQEGQRPLQLYQASLDIFSQLHDQWGQAATYCEMGLRIYDDRQSDPQTRHSQAQALLLQSLALRQAIGDRWGMAACLHHLGHIAYGLGEYPQARQYAEQSLKIYREMGDRLGLADAFSSLGQIYATEGHYREAAEYYRQCLAIRRESGSPRRLAESLDCVGYVTYLQGDDEAALHCYEESLAISRQNNDENGIAWALHNCGDIARRRGDAAEAKQLFGESYQIHQKLHPLDWGTIVSLMKLGMAAYDLSHLAEAWGYLAEAFTVAVQVKRYREATDILLELARLALANGAEEMACVWLWVVINHYATAKVTADQAAQLLEGQKNLIRLAAHHENLESIAQKLSEHQPMAFNSPS